MAHVDELRHPERAAAWLRAHVAKGAASIRRREGRVVAVALGGLGADPAVVAGLAALDMSERAAFIAASIETLDPRDVAVVVERDGARLAKSADVGQAPIPCRVPPRGARGRAWRSADGPPPRDRTPDGRLMELHDVFTRWLVSGQEGSLPRDVAVHASACPACLRAVSRVRRPRVVDARSAPEPPVIDVAYSDQRAKVVRGAMWAAGVTALLVVATTGVMAANGVFNPSPPADRRRQHRPDAGRVADRGRARQPANADGERFGPIDSVGRGEPGRVGRGRSVRPVRPRRRRTRPHAHVLGTAAARGVGRSPAGAIGAATAASPGNGRPRRPRRRRHPPPRRRRHPRRRRPRFRGRPARTSRMTTETGSSTSATIPAASQRPTTTSATRIPTPTVCRTISTNVRSIRSGSSPIRCGSGAR